MARRAYFHENFDRMLREEEYRAFMNPERKRQMGLLQYVGGPEEKVEVREVDITQFKGDNDRMEDAIANMIDRGPLDLSEL
jgi:phage protein U